MSTGTCSRQCAQGWVEAAIIRMPNSRAVSATVVRSSRISLARLADGGADPGADLDLALQELVGHPPAEPLLAAGHELRRLGRWRATGSPGRPADIPPRCRSRTSCRRWPSLSPRRVCRRASGQKPRRCQAAPSLTPPVSTASSRSASTRQGVRVSGFSPGKNRARSAVGIGAGWNSTTRGPMRAALGGPGADQRLGGGLARAVGAEERPTGAVVGDMDEAACRRGGKQRLQHHDQPRACRAGSPRRLVEVLLGDVRRRGERRRVGGAVHHEIEPAPALVDREASRCSPPSSVIDSGASVGVGPPAASMASARSSSPPTVRAMRDHLRAGGAERAGRRRSRGRGSRR